MLTLKELDSFDIYNRQNLAKSKPEIRYFISRHSIHYVQFLNLVSLVTDKGTGCKTTKVLARTVWQTLLI